MKNENELLMQHLREQIALEEHLCKTIRDQVEMINEAAYQDARELLQATTNLLELHYTPLNNVLEVYERREETNTSSNGKYQTFQRENTSRLMQISKMLRDDYAALNNVTISTTLLHTLALALGAKEVATLALSHLENLAPLVVKIGELLPLVTTRELSTEYPEVDQNAAQTALDNAKKAWKKAS